MRRRLRVGDPVEALGDAVILGSCVGRPWECCCWAVAVILEGKPRQQRRPRQGPRKRQETKTAAA